MGINLPTWLTLLRVAIIPLLAVVMSLPFAGSNYLAAFLLWLAGTTDWLDGLLARRWQQASDFGAFLDPVADKLLVCIVLVLLVRDDPRLIIAIPAVIIIGREITVSALREWMAKLGERGRVAVSQVGKYKTMIQLLAIFLMLLQTTINQIPVYETGVYLLALAAALTLWSMFIYLKNAWPYLRDIT